MMPILRSSFLGLAGVLCAGQVAMAADLPSNVAPPPIGPMPFFLFSDTSVSTEVQTHSVDPGVTIPGRPLAPTHFDKYVTQLTHVDAWAYGTNFLDIGINVSPNADPAAGGAVYSGTGSDEFFVIYHGTLSGNALTHSKTFSFGPLKDVSLAGGWFEETQNNAIAPNSRQLTGGVQFDFNVPGRLSVAVEAYQEWNHNALTQCPLGTPFNGAANSLCGLTGTTIAPGAYNPDFSPYSGLVTFKTTAKFEVNYFQPLGFTGLPLAFAGFTNVTLPKGVDGFGNNTATEVLSVNKLILDVGKLAGLKPNFIELYVGDKYWLNQYGANSHYNALNAANGSYTPGAFSNQIVVGGTLHFM